MTGSNKAVAQAWATKSSGYGHTAKNSGGQTPLFFNEDVVYSYGTHFPIARHGKGKTVYITTRRISRTTSRHISIVRQAAEAAGLDVIEMGDVLLAHRVEEGE